jgi:uncharacterized membrane-anchored protein
MWWLKDEGLRCQIFGAFTVITSMGLVGSWALLVLINFPTLLWTIPVLAPVTLFVIGAILAFIEYQMYKRFEREELDPVDKIAKDWWQD